MITSLFDRFWPRDNSSKSFAPPESAKNIAKNRLQFLLVHDRVFLSPGQMESLKRDIFDVIAKYVEIDNDNIQIDLKPLPDSRQMALVSNVPILKVKH